MTPSTSPPASVLRQLRALVPPRRLAHWEARRIVELQANRFRKLRDVTEPELIEEAISSLPRMHVQRTMKLPPGVSGVSHWHDGRWLIGLNPREPGTRQRFSLAHELCHVINHTTKGWLHTGTPRFSAYEAGERLADYFAACLLMPKQHVKRLAGEGFQPPELAAMFDVSTQAMSRRLTDLGIAWAEPTGATYVRRNVTSMRARYHRNGPCPTLCTEGAAS